MSPDAVQQYLVLYAMDQSSDARDVVTTQRMRWILKKLILRGYNINCALCGNPIMCERDLSMDHIVPKSRGGSDELCNMQPAHRKCNELKGNAMTDDDVAKSCADSGETIQMIEARKKNRKEANKKYRNIKRMKPWQVDIDLDNVR